MFLDSAVSSQDLDRPLVVTSVFLAFPTRNDRTRLPRSYPECLSDFDVAPPEDRLVPCIASPCPSMTPGASFQSRSLVDSLEVRRKRYVNISDRARSAMIEGLPIDCSDR